MQKFMKEQPSKRRDFTSFNFVIPFMLLGGSLDSEGGVSTMFHPPSKETVLTSTSTLGPKIFLFVPQQQVSRSYNVL